MLLKVVGQITGFFLFLLRRPLEMNSRSTTFVLSDVYSVQYLPSLVPFSHAGSGPLPLGTTRGASGAAQSIPGCLVKERCGWWYLLFAAPICPVLCLMLLLYDYLMLSSQQPNVQGLWVGTFADCDTKSWDNHLPKVMWLGTGNWNLGPLEFREWACSQACLPAQEWANRLCMLSSRAPWGPFTQVPQA